MNTNTAFRYIPIFIKTGAEESFVLIFVNNQNGVACITAQLT